MDTPKRNIEQKLNREITSLFKTSGLKGRIKPIGSNFTYADFLSDRMLIVSVIREGVPYSLFNVIQSYAPFTENDWASLLDISTKSLQRYKLSLSVFKPSHSEKIIEMSEVTNMGLDVFGTMQKFKLWLNTPNYSLGSMKPIDLLRDSYGKELVVSELVNINHGILA